ncbi:MAG: hypothetical protein IK090_03675 [Clostridia bacterium]|nr:hypothetical protein [Clostridia bacterium]
MHICLTDQAGRLAEADCRIVFSDGIENGKVRFETEDGKTVATLGKIVWIDGEHGEEEMLRRSFSRVLGYCSDTDAKTVAADLAASDDAIYLTNVLLEETARFLSEGKSGTPSLTVTVRISPQESSVLPKFKEEFPEETVLNQAFGNNGDPLKGRFEKFTKELTPSIPFCKYLTDLVERKGIKKYASGYPVYSLVYKASGITKYTFSKILTQKVNHPSKETVAALTIGLRLDLEEAQAFYNAAGYYLGTTDFLDRVIRFFIQEGIYSIREVNNCLFEYRRPLIGEQQNEESAVSVIIKR